MNKLNFSKDDFSSKLDQIQQGLTEEKWVNDKLEVAKKNCGFLRFLKVIVLPLARLFGADPFCHVRVNNVAVQIMDQYHTHHKGLSNDDSQKIEKILTALKEKTGTKYDLLLNGYIKTLNPDAVLPSDSAPTGGPIPTPPPRPEIFQPQKRDALASLRGKKPQGPKDANKKGERDLLAQLGKNPLFRERQSTVESLTKHISG